MLPGTVLMTSAAFRQAFSNSCSRPAVARIRSSVRTVSVSLSPVAGPPALSGLVIAACPPVLFESKGTHQKGSLDADRSQENRSQGNGVGRARR